MPPRVRPELFASSTGMLITTLVLFLLRAIATRLQDVSPVSYDLGRWILEVRRARVEFKVHSWRREAPGRWQ
jgi:hypothetical protein